MNETEREIREWQRITRRWEKSHARKRHQVRLLTPLPRKVRLRLWWAHQVDGVAIWLVVHKRFRLAELLWRASGLWS